MSRDWSTVLTEHQQVIAGLAEQALVLDRIVDLLVRTIRAGRRVFTLGNGGSAADAQHIACELVGRFKLDRPALAAIALTTDSSKLTAIGNDLGYEQVFARQVAGLVQAGDVVWALSTSGNSPNVIAGLRTAAERGAIVIGFGGRSGGEMRPLCQHLLRVPHDSSDRIQEAHSLAYHFVCERVEEELAQP